MAKSMQNVKTKEIKRVSNQEAKKMYQSKQWEYIGKYQAKRIIAQSNEERN